ncbi:LMBR1 domain-containing protein 1 [Mytilus galloprovincialis]|uniref:LMBR1 domain-containing protein 1 n=1 Tax=Mytilus galloprovincialis TaxID=29158 RepID=A0A8B6GQ92_MYTGA|nr:LMBR1 domain-containing protein 1 [Mytilus galloprovincialis]
MVSLSGALAATWVPFVVIIILALLFSVVYIKYFMSKYDPSLSTTISGIISLTIALLTVCLVPIDVFLASFMKNSDGTFKEWANSSDTRDSVENTVSIGYYTLYALVTFCLFLLLPFMYFFYEEKDESNPTSCRSKFCTASKYTVVFLIIAGVLMLIGGLVPTKPQPIGNSTEWDNVKNLFMQMGTNGGEDALSFVISILSLIGMLALITYTAYGMSALPMSLIKGQSNAKSELEKVRQKQKDNKAHIQPFEVVIGVAFQLLTLLIFLSLLLTNIDKALHGKGYKLGYALPKRTLPNPIDIVLVFCQKVFPLDYILFTAVVMYLIFCSMSGVRNIGIWFFWLKMYKIRPRRTRPQGILMLCMILMFIILAINIVVYQLTPQYSMYGSQMFKAPHNTTVLNKTSIIYKLEHCSLDSSRDDCVITRMALLLNRFFYKMWFFGAAYYWATWVFLGFMVLGFLVAVIKKRKSAIDGEVDEDDFDESDEEMIHA